MNDKVSPGFWYLNYLGEADSVFVGENGWQNLLRCLPATFSIILGRGFSHLNIGHALFCNEALEKYKAL